MAGETPAPLIDFQRRVVELRRGVQRARVEALARDPFMRFCLTYFQHRMFRQDDPARAFTPPAWFHHELTARLHKLAITPNDELAGAYARNFAKSTYGTEWFALYCAAERLRRNIPIVGAPSEEKEYQTRLRNITQEIETNDALRRDYPGLLPKRDAKNQWISYTDAEVILSNGVRIASMPFGGNIRGQSYDGYRPDLVLLDDPQTLKMARSSDQMKRGRQWIEQDLFGALGPGGSVSMLGTFLAHDCLLSWIRKPVEDGGKGWDGPCVPIEDDEQEPNWPAMFPFSECRRLERKHGTRAYTIERLLKPQADSDQILREEWFRANTYDRALLSYNKQSQRWEYNGSPLRTFQRVDPAGGKTRDKDDEFSLATVGIDPRTETQYLLGLVHLRGPYRVQVELCHSEYDQWHPERQRIEANACQQWLAQGVLETRSGTFEEYNTSRGKHERIESWAIPVENGKVKFDLTQPAQQYLLSQALEYPLGAHDDCLDAVSGACEDAVELGKGGSNNGPDTSDTRRDSADLREEW